MEESTARVVAGNSPEELAIRFLMRHAQCQQALTATAAAAQERFTPDMHSRSTECTDHEATSKHEHSSACEVPTTAAEQLTSEGSFLTRFSLAYAAARHPIESKRATETRLRKLKGSRQLDLGQSASAAA